MDIYRKHYNKKTDYGISSTRKKKILELVGKVKNKKILDIGCGSGFLAKEIREMGAQKVVGIDISNEAIKEAAKVLDEAMVLDLQTEKLECQDNYFDIIIIAEILEHVLYPENILKEAKRLLKDGGHIVISTPNFLIFSNRVRMFFGKFEYTEDGFLDRGHVHFFTLHSLRKLLKNLELKINQENHTIHDRFPEWFGNLFPSFFSFQIIVKVTKI
jgi:ubiquinone biosynthesis O-methyltransferase